MSSDLTPLRWPSEWTHPSALDLVVKSPVNCLLLERNSPLSAELRKLDLTILDAPPSSVHVVKGEWPGIHAPDQGGGGAGPTGRPWIDSNGWQVRLARVRDPGKAIWVETPFPAESGKARHVYTLTSYLLAVTDAAAFGARWVIDLDPDLRRALAAGQPAALDTWHKLMDAVRALPPRSGERPLGIVGILSDYSGGNEFSGGELLNLTARIHQPYQILDKAKPLELSGFKAIVYADAEPPAPELRRKLLTFVQSGGLLIAGEKSGFNEGKPGPADAHPRYQIRLLGEGRIALGDLSDPSLAASDAQVLLSHRYDLVRFWNGMSMGSYLTQRADGKGALLQIVNYAGRTVGEPVSVRVAGSYHSARIRQLGDAAAQAVPAVPHKDAIELHLPPIALYASIELT